jgi:predicted HicB family RNase H-like nuclease
MGQLSRETAVLQYRGYSGEHWFDPAYGILYGQVRLKRGVITFSGTNLAELEEDMRRAVDAYIWRCHQAGVEPSPRERSS